MADENQLFEREISRLIADAMVNFDGTEKACKRFDEGLKVCQLADGFAERTVDFHSILSRIFLRKHIPEIGEDSKWWCKYWGFIKHICSAHYVRIYGVESAYQFMVDCFVGASQSSVYKSTADDIESWILDPMRISAEVWKTTAKRILESDNEIIHDAAMLNIVRKMTDAIPDEHVPDLFNMLTHHVFDILFEPSDRNCMVQKLSIPWSSIVRRLLKCANSVNSHVAPEDCLLTVMLKSLITRMDSPITICAHQPLDHFMMQLVSSYGDPTYFPEFAVKQLLKFASYIYLTVQEQHTYFPISGTFYTTNKAADALGAIVSLFIRTADVARDGGKQLDGFSEEISRRLSESNILKVLKLVGELSENNLPEVLKNIDELSGSNTFKEFSQQMDAMSTIGKYTQQMDAFERFSQRAEVSDKFPRRMNFPCTSDSAESNAVLGIPFLPNYSNSVLEAFTK